jgi:hypothetical protein
MTMKTSVTVLLLASAALSVSACGSAPDGEPGSAEQGAPVTIHWTDIDATSGETILRSTVITQEQARWLREARQAKRVHADRVEAPVLTGQENIGAQRSALTVGSTAWSDCESLEWLLLSSENDFGGDIFCAKWASGALNALLIPFVPRWYDSAASSSAFFSLCTGSSSCYIAECGYGSDVYMSIFQNSGTWNITYQPNSLRYVVAQYNALVCKRCTEPTLEAWAPAA